MDRRLSAIVLCAALMLFSVASAQDLRPSSGLYGPVPVLEVVDGDTVVLGSNLGPRTVRLIGIDTPEMSEGSRGVEARERLFALLSGKVVWVEIGVEPEDRYARLLAYLYVEDPTGRWDLGVSRGTQVNLAMVEAGWADTLTIAPNTAYATLYAEARARAAASGAGLWGPNREPGPRVAEVPAAVATPRPAATAVPRLHCALVNPTAELDAGAEWVSVMLELPTDTTGYYLWDEGSRSTFRLPSGVQPAGELRVVNPGQGVWNNSGDTIYLMRGGEVVDQWTYGKELAVEGRVACRDPGNG